MSTAEFDATGVQPETSTTPEPVAEPRLMHRLKTVRREQNCSLRRAAQLLGCDVARVRHEEEETTDLPLSRLRQWQAVLNVPLADLLVEPDPDLSLPVMKRAQLVRLMKTAVAMHDRAETPTMKRLAVTLIAQLKELMPELEGISGWTSLGRRRAVRMPSRVYRDLDRMFEWFNR